MRLAHLRGVGKVNNLGFMTMCPDIYLSLDNNLVDRGDQGSVSKTQSKKFGSSSKKTDTQKAFSNRALDTPFLAPENIFEQFSEQTASQDVWSFGMIMYSLLFGKLPESYYSVYRKWHKRNHGKDIEIGNLPFTRPSTQNFIYDPFSIDFDNPFDQEQFEVEGAIGGSLKEKQTKLNFANFMKCIRGLSYSSLFADGHSKKFFFKSIAEQIQSQHADVKQPPRFPGQQRSNAELRLKVF